MLDVNGNPLDDNKMILETTLHTGTYGTDITFTSMQMMVAELYQRGIEMGWETKILNPLNDALRNL